MNPPSGIPSPTALPAGRQFAATWGIPEAYGGMTSALLHRSRAFVREAGASVEILTFDPRLDLPRVESALRSRGELIDGMLLRNVYDDLRVTPPTRQRVAVEPPRAVRAPDERVEVGGTLLVWHEGETVTRLEHRRVDGSLAVLDERERPDGPHRLLTAFDADERALRQWRSARSFYFSWLDGLISDETAYLLVDSKAIAPTLRAYRRPRVAVLHVVHGSHLNRADPPQVTRSRRPILEHLPEWDAVVVLTERQRADIASEFDDEGSLTVVPNAVTVAPSTARAHRDPLRGVIVTRLARGKRLVHALEIVAAARRAGTPATLDVYGEGDDRDRLEAGIERLRLRDAVRLCGYTQGPAQAYASASWTLLTSAAEGESLALLEAMAEGCIPVAYDIRYGPSDTIDDGRNGRLVADGDRDAATRALVWLCSRDDDELATLRRAARSRAEEHSDSRIVARWGDVERAALRRHAQRWVEHPPGAPTLRTRLDPRTLPHRVARRVQRLLGGG